MNSYQTNAIVLKRENIFEADRLYYLYTEDFGKIRTVAGGARKIGAKLAGHLEPFNLIWAELIARKNGDLFITTALSHKELLGKSSPAKIALFAKMADFACLMLKGPQKDDILWSFILKNFTGADSVKSGGESEFLNAYKTGLVKILGFGDSLEEAMWYN